MLAILLLLSLIVHISNRDELAYQVVYLIIVLLKFQRSDSYFMREKGEGDFLIHLIDSLNDQDFLCLS